jgi:hypothetical protein
VTAGGTTAAAGLAHDVTDAEQDFSMFLVMHPDSFAKQLLMLTILQSMRVI